MLADGADTWGVKVSGCQLICGIKICRSGRWTVLADGGDTWGVRVFS